MNEKCILKSADLIKYIDRIEKAFYHINNRDSAYNTIRMHKILYFCYGFWGAYALVRREEGETDEIYNKDLFSETFTAGAYGPYIAKELDFQHGIGERIFSLPKKVKDVIDEVLGMIANAGAISLVDNAKDSLAWKECKIGQQMDKNKIYRSYIDEVIRRGESKNE